MENTHLCDDSFYISRSVHLLFLIGWTRATGWRERDSSFIKLISFISYNKLFSRIDEEFQINPPRPSARLMFSLRSSMSTVSMKFVQFPIQLREHHFNDSFLFINQIEIPLK